MTRKFAIGDDLYHAVHGLCRIKQIIKAKGQQLYVLLPLPNNPAKLKYVIPEDSVEASGFHKVISAKEANHIFSYLQKGHTETADGLIPKKKDGTVRSEHQAWLFAENIVQCAQDPNFGKEQRKRQSLNFSIRGLISELAIALKIDPLDALERVQLVLRRPSGLNNSLVNALGDCALDLETF